MEYWESKYDKIFAFIPPGGMYVCIFMCVEIGKCIKRFTMKSFCIITLCLIFVFMDQNRTFLFPSLIVYIIGLLTYKTETKRKQLVLNLVVMLFVLFLILVMRESMEYLFEETVDNMNDSGGYRLIAWNYLTDTSHYTWYRCIFGRGWYSLNISDYYMKLGMNKIFLSDVGMFSFWFVYGLLSTLTIIYYYLNSILRKRFPLYLRLFSLISIFASFTVLYYQDFYKITFFVIFYYLYHLELTNFKKRYEGNSICIDACF
ncbi:MAG: hypothetical protein MJZ41_02350 [Bacteroidaceae bacterium]|nr:hypothetical protein [Bacteroidaceae bacterium]